MFRNKNKGFSLVELIVVIAILVVFAAILIPSLLQYTENSRAQKDESAMDEVVNAVQLALADQDCFDEMLKYSCTNNFVTYSDSTGDYASQIIDGEFWAPDGLGRATTITFNPETGSNNSTIYNLDTAIINDMTYGNGSVAYDRVIEGALTEDNQCYFKNASLNGNATGYTYNRVRQTVGDSVISTSQTYRNSSFTIFIRFTQKDGVTVAEVNGQFNGTNLYDGAPAAKGSGTTEYEPETGNAIVTVTNPGTQESQYAQSDFSGTGSFGGITITDDIEDYKQPTYVENLQKENEFAYYSTFEKAAMDINSGILGENADRDESDAVFGVFFKDDTYHIATLQNYEFSDGVVINKNITIILNGHKLSRNYTGGQYTTIQVNDSTCTFDGRIAGSEFIVCNDVTEYGCNLASVQNGSLLVYGGQYSTNANVNNASAYTLSATNAKQIYTQNCTITSVGYRQSCALYTTSVNKNGNIEINNCVIEAIGTGPTSANTRAVSLIRFESAIIENTKIKSIGTNVAPDDNGIEYYAGRGPVIGLYLSGSNFNVNNCTIVCSATAFLAYGQSEEDNNLVTNTKMYGGLFGFVTSETQSVKTIIKFENCHIVRDKKYTYGYEIIDDTNASALCAQHNADLYFNNCSFNTDNKKSSMLLQYGANVYMSMCSFDDMPPVAIDNKSTLYIGLRNKFSDVQSAWNNQDRIVKTNEIYSN